MNPILEEGLIEVDQKPEFEILQTEISEQLFVVNRFYFLHRFNFYDYLSVDHHIKPHIATKIDAFIHHLHGYLSFDHESVLTQLKCQCLLIDTLQQTWPQGDMYRIRTG